MQAKIDPGSTLSIPVPYCVLVNAVNNPDDPCHQENDPAPGHVNPCEMLTPREQGLDPRQEARAGGPGGDLCIRVPEVCSRPIGPGYGIIFCDYVCVHLSDHEGTSSHCSWICDTVGLTGDPGVGLGPRLGVQAPAANSTVSGDVAISGWAVDYSGIVGITANIDGEPIEISGLTLGLWNPATCQPPLGWNHFACSTSSGFTGTIDVRGVAEGLHELQLIARDGNGWITDLSLPVVVEHSVCSSSSPPMIAVSGPGPGATLEGVVTISATASSASGIQKVNFNIDGSFAGADHSSPYTLSWDTTAVTDGEHILRARAYDTCGQNTLSDPVTLTVANEEPPSLPPPPPTNDPPQVNIDSPVAGQTVSGIAVTIDGWAVDETGVASLSFFLDGAPLTLNGPPTWHDRADICGAPIGQGDPRCPSVGWRGSFDSTTHADGSHTLRVVASDGTDTDDSVRTITITNNPSGVTVTFAPTDDTFTEQDTPDTPHGFSLQFSVRDTDSGQGRFSFLKFNVTNVFGTVTGAKLVLSESYGRDIPELLIWEVLNNSWSESTLTWNTIPTPYELRSTVYNLARYGTHEIEVSDFVTGNGVVTIGLSTQTDQDLFFASSEATTSSARPKLRITYQP